jgi:hypothetical protein
MKYWISFLVSREMKALICLSIFCLTLIIGCAAVFKGTSNNVDFSSDPKGAKVYVNGALMGTTPVKLKLESKKVYNIEFKKEGYETQTFTLTNHVGVGWVILDVIFGLIPVIVDAATGSWYVLDQDYFNAVLEKE